MAKGYQNRMEYYHDYEAICAIYLKEYMDEVVAKRPVSDTVYEKYKGLVVSLEEADEAYQEHAHFALSEESTTNVLDRYEIICEKSYETSFFLPFEYLEEVFSLQPIEKIILVAACLPLINPAYQKTYGYINDNVNKHYLSLSTAVDIFVEGDKQEAIAFSQKNIFYLFEGSSEFPLSMLLKPCKRLVDLVCYGKLLPEKEGFELFYPSMKMEPLIGQEETKKELQTIFQTKEESFVYLVGRPLSGRKSLLKTVATATKMVMLFVDFSTFLQDIEAQGETNLEKKLITEILLQKAFVCFYHIDFETQKEKLLRIIEAIRSYTKKIFVCMEKKILLELKGDLTPALFFIEPPSRKESKRLWESFTLSLSKDVLLQEYANKYHFTPGEIKKVIQATEQTVWRQGRDEVTKKDLDEGCRMFLTNAFAGKADEIKTKFTLDDLVLPMEQKRQIKEALNHVIYRNVVFDEWGFEEKLPYGKGLNLLFSGPPGTGKTMAAGIIGRELSLPVYKADISRMVSKYIGDTEKGLSELFDLAQKNNCILFFDEMDSLFGKRSEVKDSHDKYANLETSYLLQRLEDYEGIVLMATNFLSNIDDAFLRRIHYIISFPMPDANMRESLWKNMFTKEMPMGEIDYPYLSQQFELSGANIKSIVMSAAFLAAEQGTKVEMKQLLYATKKLLLKQGKLLSDADFGKYAYLLS